MNAITSKGQVTIPKAIRELLDVGPGSKVEFTLGPSGDIIVRKAGAESEPRRETSRFTRFVGTLKSSMTTDDIMALTRGEA